MKTRKEITDLTKSAIENSEPLHAIAVLLAAQLEMLADIRELLTYDKDSKPKPTGIAHRVASDMEKAREQG
jgi:hypothetical protein